MNTTLLTLICALCSYLVGAANPAIILSTTIYRKDIRGLGSGNPGFTNFMRVFGKKWAWLVLTLDCSKAIVLCTVFGLLFRSNVGSFQLGAAIAGLFAVLGHCFPVWYGFEGGKGFLAFSRLLHGLESRSDCNSCPASGACPKQIHVLGIPFGCCNRYCSHSPVRFL